MLQSVEKSRFPADRDIIHVESAATELFRMPPYPSSAEDLRREVFLSKGEVGICAEFSLNTWISHSQHTVKMKSNLSFVLLLARMVTNLFQYERFWAI